MADSDFSAIQANINAAELCASEIHSKLQNCEIACNAREWMEENARRVGGFDDDPEAFDYEPADRQEAELNAEHKLEALAKEIGMLAQQAQDLLRTTARARREKLRQQLAVGGMTIADDPVTRMGMTGATCLVAFP